jgi:hypothetical protein
VTFREIGCPGAIATHDRDKLGAFCFLETGSALHFSDVATTDHAPANDVSLAQESGLSGDAGG